MPQPPPKLPPPPLMPTPTPTPSRTVVLSEAADARGPLQLWRRGTPVWATAGRGTGWWPAVAGGYNRDPLPPKPDRLRVRFLDNHLNRTVADVKATQMEAWDTGLVTHRARLQVEMVCRGRAGVRMYICCMCEPS